MFTREGDDPVGLGRPAVCKRRPQVAYFGNAGLDQLVQVLGLLHPGAAAEWQYSNDNGQEVEPIGVHIGSPDATLSILIEPSNESSGLEGWMGTIVNWALPQPKGSEVTGPTPGSVALRLAMAAVVTVQMLADGMQAIVAAA